MPAPEKITHLIIHCSDSKWGDVNVIRKWHTDPPPHGRGWLDIGYHYVITNGFLTYNELKANKALVLGDGALQKGRDLDHDGDVIEEIGAHCPGFNDRSLGICLVGANGQNTVAQRSTLHNLCVKLCARFKIPPEHILGHCETPNGKSQGKTCPDYPMSSLRSAVQKDLNFLRDLDSLQI